MPTQKKVEFTSKANEEMYRSLEERDLEEKTSLGTPRRLLIQEPVGPFSGEWSSERAEAVNRHRADSMNRPRTNSVKSDVTMEDVSGNMPYMVNAQEVPKHPMFDGTTREDKRKFMVEYEEYFASVKPFLTSISAPQLVPVSHCIKITQKRFIAEYEIRKPMDEITEDEWILHFRACKEAERKDLSALDAKMARLKLDLSLGDATSMMNTLTMKIHETCDDMGLRQYVKDNDVKRIANK